MKSAAGLLICLHFVSASFGQAFQFQQTSTTIIKTVAQSPAHWYIEIDNLCGVDTTLRWKADLSQIPAGWSITFDDQDHYHPLVMNGDSADFILFDSLSLPQKLIIGAFTNNIPATASAFFYVYNPADTAAPVLLEYVFVITPVTGLEEITDHKQILLLDGNLVVEEGVKFQYSIFAANGQKLLNGKGTNQIDVHNLPPGVYFLHLRRDDSEVVKRFCKFE